MPRAVVTDFDGTLHRSDQAFNDSDLAALREAGRRGITRIIATGRSLYSFRRTVPAGRLPIDYVLFSSGAGVVREPSDDVIHSAQLEPDQVRQAADVLTDVNLPFMLHRPVPDNHRSLHRATPTASADFHRRLERYKDHTGPLIGCAGDFGPAAQLLAVAPPHHVHLVDEVRARLDGFSVIRATSPLDHASVWIEIFPAHVSKSLTTATLLAHLGISAVDVLAIGNDYNDEDLLNWAGRGVVTANAPESLRKRFDVVPANDAGGVAAAIQQWL